MNEAKTLKKTILWARDSARTRARLSVPVEIIVSDGGSRDETYAIAQQYADKVIPGSRGRAKQLNAGAKVASGDILIFLHADTLLPSGGLLHVWHEMQNPMVIGGGFLKDWVWSPASRISDLMNFLHHLWQGFGKWVVFLQKKFPGDNAIFVRRNVFEKMGGFANLWLCEDFDFSRRLIMIASKERFKMICLRLAVKTSARRFEKSGFFKTIGIWAFIYLFWRLGTRQERLRSLFRRYS